MFSTARKSLTPWQPEAVAKPLSSYRSSSSLRWKPEVGCAGTLPTSLLVIQRLQYSLGFVGVMRDSKTHRNSGFDTAPVPCLKDTHDGERVSTNIGQRPCLKGQAGSWSSCRSSKHAPRKPYVAAQCWSQSRCLGTCRDRDYVVGRLPSAALSCSRTKIRRHARRYNDRALSAMFSIMMAQRSRTGRATTPRGKSACRGIPLFSAERADRFVPKNASRS